MPRRQLPGGPCAPPGVRFTDPSGAVAAGAADCAVLEGSSSLKDHQVLADLPPALLVLG